MTTLSVSKPIMGKILIALKLSNIRLYRSASRLYATKRNRSYLLGLLTRPTGYFLICLLAWAGISVALAEDFSC